MPKFDQLSFKWKLTLIIMLTCVVSLLAACAAFVWYDNYLFKLTMTRELETDARIISASRSAVRNNDTKAVKEALESLRAREEIVAAAVWSRDGTLLAEYLKRPGTESIPANPSALLNRFEGDYLGIFRTIKGDEGQQIGTVYLKADIKEKLKGRMDRYGSIVA